jgi:DNA mismatch endonuclease (patch repair protein)
MISGCGAAFCDKIPLAISYRTKAYFGKYCYYMVGILKSHREKNTCTDIVSPEKRSEMMSKVRSKDSVAEKKVRSALHAAGYRFRLHRKDLPGTPDIVLPKYKLVVFVHGCFWHRHEGCSKASTPKSNQEFWSKKFSDNIDRDLRTKSALEALMWRVVVIWECELNKTKFTETISRLFATL